MSGKRTGPGAMAYRIVVRELAVSLGERVAAELGVPCFVSPLHDLEYVDWWEQYLGIIVECEDGTCD